MSGGEGQKYTSARLQLWRSRQSDLKPNFVETLDKIEKFGWQVWDIFSDHVPDNFAYTVGLYDIFGLPELLTIGLPLNVGGNALNAAVRLMKTEIDVPAGRFREVVGDVEVEFQPVDRKWLHRLMLRSHWYYEGADVPVLQVVYPDLANRFQWEDGFTEHFRQPMLASGYPEGHRERDLWDANESDPKGWEFPDPAKARVYISETVQAGEEGVTYVSHDAEDGTWQFLGDLMIDGGGPVFSRLGTMLKKDPSLAGVALLPRGWYAVRDDGEKPWEFFEHEDEDDE